MAWLKSLISISFLKDAVFWGVLLAGLFGFFFYGRPAPFGAITAYAQDAAPADRQDAPRIVAATFSSAWCAPCKIIEPRLDAVADTLAQEPVAFVALDFTFGQRKEHEAIARDYGFSSAYEQYKGSTGFVLLLDAGNGEVIDVLTKKYSKAAMRAAIARALALSARDAQPSREPLIGQKSL